MAGVSRRFPKKSFVPLGKLSAERLGLSSRRSGELRLQQAWARAAGSRLAGRAAAVAIRRGVLELRMTVDDDAWCRTVLEVGPGLAVSIAAEHPAWNIEFVRLTAVNGAPIGDAQPLAGCRSVEFNAPERGQEQVPRPIDLKRVMRAYLSRSESSSTTD
jgi:hypothetical protein